MNKREFVLGSCAAVAGGATAAGTSRSESAIGAAPGLRRQRLPDLATDMRGAAWQRYVGHRFVTDAGVALQLTAVQSNDSGLPLEQFTLRFDSGSAAALPAGTHLITHGTGQRVALYLDPDEGPQAIPGACRAHFSLLS
jgi:hypothetical protein